MKKYYTTDGKEANFGDTILVNKTIKHPIFGTYEMSTMITFNKDSVKTLIDNGVIIEKDIVDIKVDMEEILNRLCVKTGLSRNDFLKYLDATNAINNTACLNILLKEIALKLDESYDDHISEAEELYVLSIVDGRIHKLCKNQIKNYKNFAAFRTIEEAKAACRALKPQLKMMFK